MTISSVTLVNIWFEVLLEFADFKPLNLTVPIRYMRTAVRVNLETTVAKGSSPSIYISLSLVSPLSYLNSIYDSTLDTSNCTTISTWFRSPSIQALTAHLSRVKLSRFTVHGNKKIYISQPPTVITILFFFTLPVAWFCLLFCRVSEQRAPSSGPRSTEFDNILLKHWKRILNLHEFKN